MKKSAIKLVLSLLILPVLPLNAQAQNAVTEQEAHEIGVNAYLYFYSLVTMDITRKQSINIEPGKQLGKGPMNMFVNVPEYPPADYKGVVRPNFDTLYSIAWLDTTKEPVVISVPDTEGVTTFCRCSICGVMFSPLRVGERPALRPGLTW